MFARVGIHSSFFGDCVIGGGGCGSKLASVLVLELFGWMEGWRLARGGGLFFWWGGGGVRVFGISDWCLDIGFVVRCALWVLLEDKFIDRIQCNR